MGEPYGVTIESKRDEGLGGAEAKGWAVAEELDWTGLWREHIEGWLVRGRHGVVDDSKVSSLV